MSHADTDGPCLSILSHEQTIGLAFIAQSGLISSSAVLLFLLIVAKNYIRNLLHPPKGPWRLIRTHVDAYFLSLLCADLLQAIGALLTIKWAVEQKTYCSAYCTTQGFLQQVGETGVALSTLAITFHTFGTIFFHARPPQWVWMLVIGVIWTFLFVSAGVGYGASPKDSPYYTPTPFWCWISDVHDHTRVFAEYFWMWFAAFINIALYIPLYFCVRGNITVHPTTRKITFNFGRSSKGFGGTGVEVKDKTKEALKLVWYPISYTAVILPISIARWSSFPQTSTLQTNELPILKTAITVFIFGLSGLVNVLVFMSTRPHILLFGPRRGQLYADNSQPPSAYYPPKSSWHSTPPTSSDFPSFPPTPYTPGSAFKSPAHTPNLAPREPDIVLDVFAPSRQPRIQLQPPPEGTRRRSSALRTEVVPSPDDEARSHFTIDEESPLEGEVGFRSSWVTVPDLDTLHPPTASTQQAFQIGPDTPNGSRTMLLSPRFASSAYAV